MRSLLLWLHASACLRSYGLPRAHDAYDGPCTSAYFHVGARSTPQTLRIVRHGISVVTRSILYDLLALCDANEPACHCARRGPCTPARSNAYASMSCGQHILRTCQSSAMTSLAAHCGPTSETMMHAMLYALRAYASLSHRRASSSDVARTHNRRVSHDVDAAGLTTRLPLHQLWCPREPAGTFISSSIVVPVARYGTRRSHPGPAAPLSAQPSTGSRFIQDCVLSNIKIAYFMASARPPRREITKHLIDVCLNGPSDPFLGSEPGPGLMPGTCGNRQNRQNRRF